MVSVLPAMAPSPAQPGHAVGDRDLLTAQLVLAVGHAGRGHRVGDQGDPAGPAAATTWRSMPSCRWTPSATCSQTTPGASSSATIGPGSRWWIGRMRVAEVGADASRRRSTAASVCSYVASVWPDRGDDPVSHEQRDRVQGAGQFRCDGHHADAAEVEQRGRARRGRGRADRPGSGRRTGPRDRYGPSRCTPARTPSATSGAKRRRWPRRAGRAGAVTRLASMVVVPCRRVERGRGAGLLGVAGGERVAAAAVHVDVDEAGQDPRRVAWTVRMRPARATSAIRSPVDAYHAVLDDAVRRDHPAPEPHVRPPASRRAVGQVEGEQGGAETARPRRRVPPGPAPAGGGTCAALQRRPQRVEQDRPGLGQPAAEHDEFGVVAARCR